jgi:predicted alpha/beta-hydrolase family hydrolase
MTDLWFDGPADARWTLLLAHGAGQGMDSPFMHTMAQGLAAAGMRVARFDFPYMLRAKAEGRRRPPDRAPLLLDAYRAAIDALRASGVDHTRLLIGGKSMGGRIASLLADEQGVAGLVCLGYPFHPPGKPDTLRTEHLRMLHTPTLICQGERDPFGRRDEVSGYPLSAAITVAWLPDGEHSFKPRKAAGHSEADNLAQAVRLIMDFAAGLGT